MTCPSCGAQAGERGRFCAECGTPLAAGPAGRESRKKVSILFMDIVGSTTLAERMDPEALRQIMDSYFAACGAAIADHGGVVEKFIGDAILAVFGATVAREDDAVRAVRAAVTALGALQDLSAELMASYQVSLEARCGICTGDVVVTLLATGDFRVIGDAVNTASRLQNAAPPGGILLDAATAAMARSQVAIEPVTPLALKGKAQAVPAWRVAGTDLLEASAPDSAAPFIGRGDELDELRHSFRRAARRRQACLVTVLGGPGIGKSRLVREFLATLPDGPVGSNPALSHPGPRDPGADNAAGGVTVLSGRSSAYGRGITYQPLAQMLRSYPGGWPALAAVLSDEEGALAVRSLATIMNEAPATGRDSAGSGPAGSGRAGLAAEAGAGPVGVEDISWAVRYLLEALGRTRPLVLVWEDLHQSEQTLLDLVDDIATWLTDVPVLVLCVARTELLEVRPGWGGGKPCAMALELGPLSYEQSATLVTELAMTGDVYAHEQQEVCERVAGLCDGNPLFAELLLDVFAEAGPADQVPPTIQAVLGARLDQLPGPERAVIELAATIGRDFTREALTAMAQADEITSHDLGERLGRLTRRRVIRQVPPGSYSFAQALLRDTAYAFTSKARRERWHDFLACWYSGNGSACQASGSGVGLTTLSAAPGGTADPMVMAYHVEAAWRLHRELRPGDPTLPPLASAAADALTAEGMQALGRKDLPAAIALLERARDLLPPGDARHTALAVHIADAGLGLWDEGRPAAALAAAEAALPGSRRNAAACAVSRDLVALRLGLASPSAVVVTAERIAAELAGDPDDHLSWSRLHQLQAHVHLISERTAAAEAALRLALARARAMGDRYEEERLVCAICELAQWTPTPVRDGLELCAALADRFAAGRGLLVPVLVTQAYLLALGADVAGARRALATARASTSGLHLDLADAAVMEMTGFVESLAGDHRQAEAHYRRALAVLRTAQQAPDTQNIEVAIARELFRQGRAGAAALALDRIEAGAPVMSTRARIASTGLRARIAAASGRHEQALALARDAEARCAVTDDPCLAAQALTDLAVAARAAGQPQDARRAGRDAQRLLAAKGADMLAARLREWLDADENEAGGHPRETGADPA
ncbi:MAG TPA: adenylate/guanylate cyclase domain-containing protein [Trebonia sp.]|nr:adenylate/guanylate cyclase domain-containing protein [Trebonia sp.]